MAEDRASEAIRVIEASGKLRNGVFLRAIALFDDRVAFEIFASRPFAMEEFATLRLTDAVGTEYGMVAPGESVIAGHARIEFKPAPPRGLSGLNLGQPGWGLHIRCTTD